MLNEFSCDRKHNWAVIGVGTMIDLADERTVTKEEAIELFSKQNPPMQYCEVSSKTGEGIEDLLMKTIEMSLSLKNVNAEQVEEEKKKNCIVM